MNTTRNQQSAIESKASRIAIIAGPGSGKTAVLCERIRHLWKERGVFPNEIVAITYTNAAADEIQERIGGLKLGYVGTLHGFCMKLIRSGAAAPPYLSVCDESTVELACSMAMNETKASVPKSKLIALVKGDKIAHVATTKIDRVAKRAQQILAQSFTIHYDEVLRWGLSEAKALGVVRLDGTPITHLMVDEFQDAAAIDAEIYEMLRIPNKLVVGDPDQAIYGFRGGDVTQFYRFALTPGTEIIRLEENFRSAVAICFAANGLIGNNARPIAKSTRSVSGAPGDVASRTFDSSAMEYAWIVCHVADRLQHGTVGVLTRTNREASDIKLALESHGIKVGGRESVDLPKDWGAMIAMIGLLKQPSNRILQARWLSFKHDEETALKIVSHGMEWPTIARPDNWTVADLPAIAAGNGLSSEVVEALTQSLPLATTSVSLDDLIITLAGQRDASKAKSEAVWVGTIHSAKGKEWDSVVLAGMIDRKFKDKSEEEEERRLAYVGITRARTSLDFTTPLAVKAPFSPLMPTERSRFILEALRHWPMFDGLTRFDQQHTVE